MSRFVGIAVCLVLLSAFSGCYAGWEEVQYCGDDDVCEHCVSDAECSSAYSCCGETWFCYHRDEEELIVCDMACNYPSASPCRCLGGECRFD